MAKVTAKKGQRKHRVAISPIKEDTLNFPLSTSTVGSENHQIFYLKKGGGI